MRCAHNGYRAGFHELASYLETEAHVGGLGREFHPFRFARDRLAPPSLPLQRRLSLTHLSDRRQH